MPPRLLKRSMFGEIFEQHGRSHGKHVSEAIKRIMKAIHPDRFTDRPIDMIRSAVGNALERAIHEELARIHPDQYCRPGELELDDWYGTPDLWDIRNPKDTATVEMKLTWASSRRAADILDEWFWRYWVQLQAYEHMKRQQMRDAGMRVPKLGRGRLYICFINGNYSRDDNDPENGPVVKGWEDTWTDEQLIDNWNMLKAQC